MGIKQAGNAIVDILSGKVNPSGKLCTTFPVNYADVPSSKNFPGKEFPEKAVLNAYGRKETPAEVVYEDGVYVGYRYYNTFHIEPAYPFGFGLSYTHFSYSGLVLSSQVFHGRISAKVTITNDGKTGGKEVVELYVSAPGKHLDKPSEELKAFAKTILLQPGQSQTLEFSLSAQDLASFDPASESWVAEAGNYIVKVGPSSATVWQALPFSLAGDLVTERVNRILSPRVAIRELKP